MPHHLALALKETVDREAAHLRAVAERDAAEKPLAHVWSKKEELGHLTDSAANNHVRFVRAAIEPEFRGPGYEQDSWVSLHGYHDMRWTGIIDFWQQYNHFLAGLVGRIPEDRLATPCVIGESVPVTLKFLIEDYTLHMQHHLDHILEREKITEYPGAALGV
jgi:hypothetical protein